MKLLCTIYVFLCSLGAFSQAWELKKDANNIKVYTRELDSTKINEYKVVLISDASPEKVMKVILDGDNLWRWNHKTSESKIVRKVSEDEFIFWMKNDLPWPIRNRDIVSSIKVTHLNENTVRIDLAPDETNAIPENPCCIRVTNFKGYWLIRPLENHKVEITQQLYGDPNGSLPAWVLNSILTTVPYHTFLNLKDQLERGS